MAKKRAVYAADPAEVEANAQKKADGHIILAFARTLDQLLVERGIDQEKMAADLGISEGGISNYRLAKSEPRLSTIVKMANYLGVDCHYLLTGIRAEHKSLEKIGFSAGAIQEIQSWGLTQEEVDDFRAEQPGGSYGIVYSSSQSAMNAMLESNSIRGLLIAVSNCLLYDAIPTAAEQQIGLLSEIFHTPDIDKYIPSISERIVIQAEQDCRDLAIFKVQKAAIALAEELSARDEK